MSEVSIARHLDLLCHASDYCCPTADVVEKTVLRNEEGRIEQTACRVVIESAMRIGTKVGSHPAVLPVIAVGDVDAICQ